MNHNISAKRKIIVLENNGETEDSVSDSVTKHYSESSSIRAQIINKDYKISNRNWSFTDWDISDNHINNLKNNFNNKGQYCFQVEICPNTKKQHLQGNLKSKNLIRLSWLRKLMPSAYIKITEKEFAAESYCHKSFTRDPNYKLHTNIKRLLAVYRKPLINKLQPFIDNNQLLWWQKEILDIIEGPISERTIYWYWALEGSKGRTALVTWLLDHKACTLGGGKQGDMAYALKTWYEDKKNPTLEIYIINLTYGEENNVDYNGLEHIKDGAFFSPKFKSKPLRFNPPHVIILANYPPKEDKYSNNGNNRRLIVKEIKTESFQVI